MGIEEIKDLIHEVCNEFINEIGEFRYERELTQEDIDMLCVFLELFNGKLDMQLDDVIDNTKRNIQSLENYIENCAYGKRELQELSCLKYRLAVLESEGK